MTAPKCDEFGAWGGLLFRARSALGRWNSGATPASDVLTTLVLDLGKVCKEIVAAEDGEGLLALQPAQGWTVLTSLSDGFAATPDRTLGAVAAPNPTACNADLWLLHDPPSH